MSPQRLEGTTYIFDIVDITVNVVIALPLLAAQKIESRYGWNCLTFI